MVDGVLREDGEDESDGNDGVAAVPNVGQPAPGAKNASPVPTTYAGGVAVPAANVSGASVSSSQDAMITFLAANTMFAMVTDPVGVATSRNLPLTIAELLASSALSAGCSSPS